MSRRILFAMMILFISVFVFAGHRMLAAPCPQTEISSAKCLPAPSYSGPTVRGQDCIKPIGCVTSNPASTPHCKGQMDGMPVVSCDSYQELTYGRCLVRAFYGDGQKCLMPATNEPTTVCMTYKGYMNGFCSGMPIGEFEHRVCKCE